MERRIRSQESDNSKQSTKPKGGLYFSDEDVPDVFTSGCALLDCVLGGGWARKRVVNIIGDNSSGKTLLATESSRTFLDAAPDGIVYYNDCEAAFDVAYARRMGLPRQQVKVVDPFDTVEDLFEHMDRIIEKLKAKPRPCLYIVDSLDSLSDRAELARKPGDNTFGMGKAKMMSQLFRRLVRRMKKVDMTLFIISQVRDKIGIVFGNKQTRAGGKALDFYASQIVWLAKEKKIEVTRKGIKRKVGIYIKAKCDKNKIGEAYRDCKLPLIFSYGMDDVRAGVEWLAEVKGLDLLGVKASRVKEYLSETNRLSDDEFNRRRRKVVKAVRKVWGKIEEDFKPTRRKYS